MLILINYLKNHGAFYIFSDLHTCSQHSGKLHQKSTQVEPEVILKCFISHLILPPEKFFKGEWRHLQVFHRFFVQILCNIADFRVSRELLIDYSD